MKDRRDECGCHKSCHIFKHDCPKPCEWPNCLTPEEHAELLAKINEEDLW